MVDYCIFVVLLSFYSAQSIEYNNRCTRAGWDGEERIGIRPTQAATETRDGKGGQERAGTFSILFKFCLLSFSFFFFPVASFSTEYDSKRGGMVREERGRDYVSFASSSGNWRATDACHVIFCSLLYSFLLLALLLFQLSTVQ